jgi:large subunit ribosomal protein L9
MEVILLEKIQNVGELGEQVKVRSGFGRNYLIPYGKAVIASTENMAKFEAQRAEFERQQADTLAAAQARADKVQGATIQIVRKLSEEGKLFGSVSTKDIADALKETGFEISKSEIQLPKGPIKETGDHDIPISLHPELKVKIIVSVVGES